MPFWYWLGSSSPRTRRRGRSPDGAAGTPSPVPPGRPVALPEEHPRQRSTTSSRQGRGVTRQTTTNPRMSTRDYSNSPIIINMSQAPTDLMSYHLIRTELNYTDSGPFQVHFSSVHTRRDQPVRSERVFIRRL